VLAFGSWVKAGSCGRTYPASAVKRMMTCGDDVR
jgi:hypothetical protein